MDFIFIHGAPGSGKSSLAWALQKKFESPCFEFGWIPEFRVKQNSTITYEEEESLAFENLTLVVKNYVRNGFGNIIITDLRDDIMKQVPKRFSRYRYILVTLVLTDESLLKGRVLEESRSSGYRDWEASMALNAEIRSRSLMKREVRLASDRNSVGELAERVLELVAKA